MGGEGVTASAFAVSGGDRITAAEHLLGKIDIGIVTKALLIRTILAEDFDAAHIIGRYNDVAVWMRGARDI